MSRLADSATLLADGVIRQFAVETDSLLCRPTDVDGERTLVVRALLRILGMVGGEVPR
ncbi:hypothetical protein [Paraburkholderia antibiotica]|uniref:Uncharacterized protein n=1 Tax=Paraburkholderia antibiotica TaxID=2728839 RepID=A0A7X9X146_9BURK|nr:hypothetical protein [Paraburkholderia antibiotica]NML29518.1 hypothetical protein [Paraburkholderia antibiotica]